ncbi:hypothetical protein OCU04_009709 [Sclerotinia nivalis]|uniref:Piwi domain-containing protein n=1 Tax=Sclerotinia nivalis TaxID=352851 RepID=A0A9X0DFS0_9HELO|nr:hypothetical protein OCU04_009709 [Sclerotinia nivalis]
MKKRDEALKVQQNVGSEGPSGIAASASTSGVAAPGILSALNTGLAATSISGEDPYAGMTDRQKQKAIDQKKWDEELPNMTKAPSKRGEHSSGSAIKANFLKLGFNPSIRLYRYSISFGYIEIVSKRGGDPRRYIPTNRDTKRHLINSMLTQSDSDPLPTGGVAWASDFDSTIISAGELYPGLTISSPDQFVRHTRTGQNGSTPPTMKSQVRFLGIVTIDELVKHCSFPSKSAAGYLPNEDLKAPNIISWKNINSSTFNGGRRGNKFYPADILDSGQESQKNDRPYMIRQGFFSSVRPGQDSVLLNVNTSTSAFYSPILLSRWIELQWRKHRLDPTNENDRRKFQSKLKGVRVVFTAGKPVNRHKRAIFEISDKRLGGITFAKNKEKPNEKTLVFSYLSAKYGNLFRKDDYCINLGNRSDKRWYPSQYLEIVDWQPVTKVLEDEYAEEMINIAQINPRDNQSRILNHALPLLGLTGQNSRFYKVRDERISVLCLIQSPVFSRSTASFAALHTYISSSNLLLAEKKREVAPNENASWKLSKDESQESKLDAKLNKLGVLWLCDRPSQDLLGYLKDTMKSLGMGVDKDIELVHTSQIPPTSGPPPHNPSAPYSLDSTYRKRCQQSFSVGLNDLNMSGKVLLVIVVLPKQDNNLYAEIKRWGDCVVGVPTSCITLNKLENKEDYNFCANVALKINFKLKGVSHGAGTRCGADISTMIMGADVTHENAARGCPSTAAVVAKNDDENNLYLGSARLQKGKQEFIADLDGMVHERLCAWYRKHTHLPQSKQLPQNIILYCDGVSESQYGMVRSEEMPKIKEACQSAWAVIRGNNKFFPAYKPNITIIVVTKRHHTRFYPSSPRSTENNAPGLVIDTDIITPNQFSFYLQSHASPLGTARSSHYVVLEDGQKFRENPFKLQTITNNICYVSARASQALRECTPALYADILCDRLRCYMKPSLDHRDTHRPAKIPDENAENFDLEGDYSRICSGGW